MESTVARPRGRFTLLVVLTVVLGIASIASDIAGASFARRATASIESAQSIAAIGAAMQTRDYKLARTFKALSWVFGVPFVVLLISLPVVRKRLSRSTVALLIASVLTGFACSRTSETPHARTPPRRVTFPMETCKFETFAPSGDLSPSARTLLNALGTGILNQRKGSVVKLSCAQGDAFPGWIDAQGNPVSALHGVSWVLNTADFSPGNASSLKLWAKKGDGWYEADGTLQDKNEAVSSSKSASATYSILADGAVSEYSARLLNHFGIGVAGRRSRVKVKLGDYSGTGQLEPNGRLQIIDESRWLGAQQE